MKKAKENYGYESTFPRRLRAIMADSKTTHKAIAEICGVRSQSVSMWVNGQTRPDILSLVKIAEHFKVSTDYLLGLTDCKTTDKATVGMCKTLGLSEETVQLLSKDVSSPIAHSILRNVYRRHLRYFNETQKQGELNVIADNMANVINSLVAEFEGDIADRPLLLSLMGFFAGKRGSR